MSWCAFVVSFCESRKS